MSAADMRIRQWNVCALSRAAQLLYKEASLRRKGQAWKS
jgi:hypothetical protein